MQATVAGLLGRETLHARIEDIPARHYHHIKPTGSGPSIRLAITPAGEFHRLDRPKGEGPR
jgi:hypothetical protein